MRRRCACLVAAGAAADALRSSFTATPPPCDPRTGAALLPCFTMIDSSSRLRIVIQAPLQFAKGEIRAQLEPLASDYASRIEEYIQQKPTNVFGSQYLSLAKPVPFQASKR